MTTVIKRLLTISAVAMLGAGLSACDEDEQNRIIHYQKGVYLGKADQALTPEQVRQLEIRTNGQRAY
jgi:hypothetical protein